MTPETVRVALIGCGRISQVHIHAVQHEPRARLVGVMDAVPAAAQAAAEACGVPAFTDLEALLAAAEPQAVIVCTPPSTHRSVAEAALLAGAHVLCEKPLTISLEDAAGLHQAADRAGRVLMMASKFRYVSDVVKARGILKSGLLGEPVLLENEFCARVNMSKRWNSDPGISGGGVLIDNGSHSVDIVRYLAGPIEKIKAVFGKPAQGLEVEDTARLFAYSHDGTMASIDLSWSIHKENPFYIEIYGTEGTLQVGWKKSRYRQSEKVDWVDFGFGYDKFQAVGAQLANFLDTIAGRAEPLITMEDAIESVRVIQTAYHTAAGERWEGLIGG